MARSNKQKFIRKRRLKLLAVVLIGLQLLVIAFIFALGAIRGNVAYTEEAIMLGTFGVFALFSFIMHFIQYKSMSRVQMDYADGMLDSELTEERRFVMKKFPWPIRLFNLIFGLLNVVYAVAMISVVFSIDGDVNTVSIISIAFGLVTAPYIALYVVINSISAYLYHDYPPEVINDEPDEIG